MSPTSSFQVFSLPNSELVCLRIESFALLNGSIIEPHRENGRDRESESESERARERERERESQSKQSARERSTPHALPLPRSPRSSVKEPNAPPTARLSALPSQARQELARVVAKPPSSHRPASKSSCKKQY